MDFIKTSSLRALIELTFQRNWNGIIWMSRKGVYKRVKTVQTAYRESAAHTGPRNERTVLPACIRISAKSTPASRPDPGKQRPAVGRSSSHHKPRTTAARTGRQRLAAAQPMYRGRPIRPTGKHVPSGQVSSAKSSVRPRGRPNYPATTSRPSDGRHDPMSGRSSRRPSQRSGRPEARFTRFQARLNPKPPLKT
ncbi:unnamed protein product [Microthlaspi erraticum]|uniref:Uncharacterized protein n=1 Tax=Microthlaspi erraticum TaxID=1685480 RepID=A0A6D2JFK4_9BRAS|nr:unnamed protein product [Microthlaspi erraticum]